MHVIITALLILLRCDKVNGKSILKHTIHLCGTSFFLQKHLKSTEFNFIYNAYHQDSDAMVSIKEEFNFNRQVQALEITKIANNPNVVQFICSEQHLSTGYIVTEYCDNGNFAEYLEESGVNEQQGRLFLQQLANGLQFLHRKRIAHRNLTPENLLLTSDLTLKIAGFGSAVVFKGALQRSFSNHVGTKGFRAPEITQIQSHGRSVDLFSVGTILHAMFYPVSSSEITTTGSAYPLTRIMQEFMAKCMLDESHRISEIAFFKMIKRLQPWNEEEWNERKHFVPLSDREAIELCNTEYCIEKNTYEETIFGSQVLAQDISSHYSVEIKEFENLSKYQSKKIDTELHENVLGVICVEEKDHSIYSVRQISTDDGTLRELLDQRDSGIDEQKVRYYLVQIFNAITFMLNKSIKPAKLSPSSIYFDNDYETVRLIPTAGKLTYIDYFDSMKALGSILYQMLFLNEPKAPIKFLRGRKKVSKEMKQFIVDLMHLEFVILRLFHGSIKEFRINWFRRLKRKKLYCYREVTL